MTFEMLELSETRRRLDAITRERDDAHTALRGARAALDNAQYLIHVLQGELAQIKIELDELQSELTVGRTYP